MAYSGYTSSPSASPSNTIFSKGSHFDGTSDSSRSNSPHLSHKIYNNSISYETYPYRMISTGYYPARTQMKIPMVVTSSTLDEKERRRRRNEAAKDQVQETIPSMHLRRRAQNRASQRAFRERKEKHVKGLEHQLEELHEKHQDLLHSYSKQVDEVTRLNGRIAELAAELHAVRHCSNDSLQDLTLPAKFDKFDAFSATDLAYQQNQCEVYYDKGPIDLNSEYVMHSFEETL